jgi:molybdopterin synthase catalytic subunit
MRVSVLLFATLKERAGTGAAALALPGASATVDDVRAALGVRFPALVPNLPTAVCAVNQEFAFGGEAVRDGDEVAFFPPVSGGAGYADICRLADSALDLDALLEEIKTADTGAVCVFGGVVRGQTRRGDHAGDTTRLEYEAYAPMALAKMRQVAREIRERWPLVQGIAIVQRVGRLEVGDNTIVIACASGHRDEGCFEGARYGIDRLKEIVPVWKQEIRPDGSAWVEGPYQPDAGDREAREKPHHEDRSVP